MAIPNRPSGPPRSPEGLPASARAQAGRVSAPPTAPPPAATSTPLPTAPTSTKEATTTSLPTTEAKPETPEKEAASEPSPSSPAASSPRPGPTASTRQAMVNLSSVVQSFVSGNENKADKKQEAKETPAGGRRSASAPSDKKEKSTSGRSDNTPSVKSRKPPTKATGQQKAKKKSSGNKTKLAQRGAAQKAANKEAVRQDELDSANKKLLRDSQLENQSSAGQDREGDGRREQSQHNDGRSSEDEKEKAGTLSGQIRTAALAQARKSVSPPKSVPAADLSPQPKTTAPPPVSPAVQTKQAPADSVREGLEPATTPASESTGTSEKERLSSLLTPPAKPNRTPAAPQVEEGRFGTAVDRSNLDEHRVAVQPITEPETSPIPRPTPITTPTPTPTPTPVSPALPVDGAKPPVSEVKLPVDADRGQFGAFPTRPSLPKAPEGKPVSGEQPPLAETPKPAPGTGQHSLFPPAKPSLPTEPTPPSDPTPTPTPEPGKGQFSKPVGHAKPDGHRLGVQPIAKPGAPAPVPVSPALPVEGAKPPADGVKLPSDSGRAPHSDRGQFGAFPTRPSLPKVPEGKPVIGEQPPLVETPKPVPGTGQHSLFPPAKPSPPTEPTPPSGPTPTPTPEPGKGQFSKPVGHTKPDGHRLGVQPVVKPEAPAPTPTPVSPALPVDSAKPPADGVKLPSDSGRAPHSDRGQFGAFPARPSLPKVPEGKPVSEEQPPLAETPKPAPGTGQHSLFPPAKPSLPTEPTPPSGPTPTPTPEPDRGQFSKPVGHSKPDGHRLGVQPVVKPGAPAPTPTPVSPALPVDSAKPPADGVKPPADSGRAPHSDRGQFGAFPTRPSLPKVPDSKPTSGTGHHSALPMLPGKPSGPAPTPAPEPGKGQSSKPIGHAKPDGHRLGVQPIAKPGAPVPTPTPVSPALPVEGAKPPVSEVKLPVDADRGQFGAFPTRPSLPKVPEGKPTSGTGHHSALPTLPGKPSGSAPTPAPEPGKGQFSKPVGHTKPDGHRLGVQPVAKPGAPAPTPAPVTPAPEPGRGQFSKPVGHTKPDSHRLGVQPVVKPGAPAPTPTPVSPALPVEGAKPPADGVKLPVDSGRAPHSGRGQFGAFPTRPSLPKVPEGKPTSGTGHHSALPTLPGKPSGPAPTPTPEPGKGQFSKPIGHAKPDGHRLGVQPVVKPGAPAPTPTPVSPALPVDSAKPPADGVKPPADSGRAPHSGRGQFGAFPTRPSLPKVPEGKPTSGTGQHSAMPTLPGKPSGPAPTPAPEPGRGQFSKPVDHTKPDGHRLGVQPVAKPGTPAPAPVSPTSPIDGAKPPADGVKLPVDSGRAPHSGRGQFGAFPTRPSLPKVPDSKPTSGTGHHSALPTLPGKLSGPAPIPEPGKGQFSKPIGHAKPDGHRLGVQPVVKPGAPAPTPTPVSPALPVDSAKPPADGAKPPADSGRAPHSGRGQFGAFPARPSLPKVPEGKPTSGTGHHSALPTLPGKPSGPAPTPAPEAGKGQFSKPIGHSKPDGHHLAVQPASRPGGQAPTPRPAPVSPGEQAKQPTSGVPHSGGSDGGQYGALPTKPTGPAGPSAGGLKPTSGGGGAPVLGTGQHSAILPGKPSPAGHSLLPIDEAKPSSSHAEFQVGGKPAHSPTGSQKSPWTPTPTAVSPHGKPTVFSKPTEPTSSEASPAGPVVPSARPYRPTPSDQGSQDEKQQVIYELPPRPDRIPATSKEETLFEAPSRRSSEAKRRRDEELDGGERAVRENLAGQPHNRLTRVEYGHERTTPLSGPSLRIDSRATSSGFQGQGEPSQRQDFSTPGRPRRRQSDRHESTQAPGETSQTNHRETAARRSRFSNAAEESGQSSPVRSSRLKAARGESSLDNPSSDNLEQLGRHFLYGTALTPSEERQILSRKVQETERLSKLQEASAEPQIQWSRSRAFGRTLDRSVKSDAEVLTREERVVHGELLRVVPSDLKMSDVRIDDDTSRVQAKVVVKTAAEAEQWQRARHDFEARTGRVLDLNLIDETAPRTRPVTPQTSGSQLSQPKASRREEESQLSLPVETPLEPIRRERATPQSETVKVSNPALEVNPSLAAVAASLSASVPMKVETSIHPLAATRKGLEVGVAGPVQNQRTHLIVGTSQSGGGGSRSSRKLKHSRDEDEGTTQGQEGSITRTSKEARVEEPITSRVQELLSSEERHQHERDRQGEQGGRGGSANCATCGTLLPESQAQACPVCAQSGPDVMAMTSIHYRSGGSKFLATVDLFSATDDARELILSGEAPSILSLRYEQDIPGHKDFLKFKATS